MPIGTLVRLLPAVLPLIAGLTSQDPETYVSPAPGVSGGIDHAPGAVCGDVGHWAVNGMSYPLNAVSVNAGVRFGHLASSRNTRDFYAADH